MSQSQVNYSLITQYFRYAGINPKKDQSKNAAAMKVYTDLANILADYKKGENRDETRRALEEMRLAFKERDSLLKHTAAMANIEVKNINGMRSAASRVESATITARTKLEGSRDRGLGQAVSKLEEELGGPVAKAGSERIARKLVGSLAAEGEYGGIATSTYSKLLDQLKTDHGVDLRDPAVLNDLPPDVRQGMDLFIERARVASEAQDALETDLKGRQEEFRVLREQLDKVDVKDENAVADLQRKLQKNAEEQAAIVEGADFGMSESEISKRIRQINEEDSTIQVLEDRLKQLDKQLFGKRGPVAGAAVTLNQQQRIALVVGRENFREWAFDNGYTEEDLGYSELDASGRPIMSSFLQGKKAVRAVKHFEYQLKNPDKQSRLFGVGKRTNELHVFDLLIDPEQTNSLKHPDGKWRTISSPEGATLYVSADQFNDYDLKYNKPTVMLGVGNDKRFYAMVDGRYYLTDKNGTSYERVQSLPSDFKFEAIDNMAINDQEGKAIRYATEEDLLSGESILPAQANDEEKAAIAKYYADLKVQEYDSPPEGATRRVTAVRQRTHAWGVQQGLESGNNLQRYIDVDTGTQITVNPQDISNLEVHDIRSTTNLKDFKNHLRSQRLQRVADRTLGRAEEAGTDETATEKSFPGGVQGRYHGATKRNVFDAAIGIFGKPDKTPEYVPETEETVRALSIPALQDELNRADQLVSDAVEANDLARERAENATSAEKDQLDAEYAQTQKTLKEAQQALSKVQRRARKAGLDTPTGVAIVTGELPTTTGTVPEDADDGPLPESAAPVTEGVPGLQAGAATDDARIDLLQKASDLMNEGKYDEADQALGAHDAAGGDTTASDMMRRGIASMKQQDAEEASVVVEQVGGTAKGSFDSAVTKYRNKDYEGALADFEKSYKLDPRPNILRSIAQTKSKLGDTKGANEALQQYQDTSKDSTEVVAKNIEQVKGRIESDTSARVAEFGQELEEATKPFDPATTPLAQATQEMEDDADAAKARVAAEEQQRNVILEALAQKAKDAKVAADIEAKRDAADEQRKKEAEAREAMLAAVQKSADDDRIAAETALLQAGDDVIAQSDADAAAAVQEREERARLAKIKAARKKFVAAQTELQRQELAQMRSPEGLEDAPEPTTVQKPSDIVFQPAPIQVNEPQGGASLKESASSSKREAASRGNPGMDSPTDTAQVTSGVGVPSGRDKYTAEAKELVKKNLEIRNILFPQDDAAGVA